MSVPRKESPNQYEYILLFGEGRREREALGDRKEDVHARRAPRLQKSPPEQGVGTAGLPHRLPLSPLKA